MNRIFIFAVSLAVFCSGMIVTSIDFNAAAPILLSTAHAYYYGQGRRVARRTARRTSRRHDYSAAPAAVYGAGAVATTATAVAIGTQVATLPGGCSSVVVNGITYYNCNGAYYQPVYDGPNVVYVVVPQP